MQHVGYLRHLLLRRGDTTGEILVNLVTTTQEEYDLSELTEQLLQLPLEGKIVGILHILNDSLSDVVKAMRRGFYMVRISFMKNCSDYNLRLHRSPFSAKYKGGGSAL